MARSGKKRDSQAFSAGTPHSAPIEEMARSGLALEENRDFRNLEEVVARCGYGGQYRSNPEFVPPASKVGRMFRVIRTSSI
jgi:hypothetical protein